jgi:hypothetical protein
MRELTIEEPGALLSSPPCTPHLSFRFSFLCGSSKGCVIAKINSTAARHHAVEILDLIQTDLLPKYSTHVKNLRAAGAIAKELPTLSGEALLQQQAKLNELLCEANVQQEAYKKANPGVGAS